MDVIHIQHDFFPQLISEYPRGEMASSFSQVFGLELLHLRKVFGLEAISEIVPDLWTCLAIHLIIGTSMAMGGIESTGLS